MLLIEQVQQLIDREVFPTIEEFVTLFSDGGTQFIQQEDVKWDFKDQWPFSYSDEYFLGIARLTAAFANTSGGFIIFGVHDEKRLGGYNKVKVNTDKFRQSVVAYMGRCPTVEVRHYNLAALGEIDCLFVSPRKMGEQPYRFTRDTKYKWFFWVRDGHSVAKAEPRHIPLLYCRIDERSQTEYSKLISGSLPPSPRKIDKFIGRLESMDYLFNWLYNSDEPLAYLYGKGGSGKTTIAHEFASIIKRYGADVHIYQNDSIDLVLFLSAKEKSFLPGDNSGIIPNETDFWDERSLYVNILRYSGLSPKTKLSISSNIKRYIARKTAQPNMTLNEMDVDTIKVHLAALGLLHIRVSQATTGGLAEFISLTENGRAELLRQMAVKSKRSP